MKSRFSRLIGIATTLALIGGTLMSHAHAETERPTQPVLDKDRTALVFIEFQDEWIGEDATLRDRLVKDRAAFDKAAANAEKVIAAARAHGWTIAHAGLDLRHDRAYRLFNGGEDMLGLRRAIPNAGTWTGEGAQFVAPFVPEEDEFVAVGRSGASVLKNSTLDPFLRNNDINTLVIMGFATHVCVESTLREGHDLGYNVHVVTDASGAFTADQQEHFETHILHHFGAGVTTEQLVRTLAEPGL